MSTAKIIAEIEHAIDTDRECPADVKRWLLALAEKVQELEMVSHDKENSHRTAIRRSPKDAKRGSVAASA